MQVINKLMMFHVAVLDMPKAREFYEGILGLKVTKNFRRDDNNWWVELVLPEGGVSITLSTHHGHMKPGTLTLYFATSDIEGAHKELSDKGVKTTEIKGRLHGPGSDTKWFKITDPDGNLIHIEQA